jgi:hypothetical protein
MIRYAPASSTTSIPTAWAYAKARGFSLGAFDPVYETAPNSEARERAMIGSIAGQVANKNITIVHCGATHLPRLYEKLSSKVTTIAMKLVLEPLPGDTENVKDLSYVLSRPEILKIRADPATIGSVDAPLLDAAGFMRARRM